MVSGTELKNKTLSMEDGGSDIHDSMNPWSEGDIHGDVTIGD
jgi:hypothetical protein